MWWSGSWHAKCTILGATSTADDAVCWLHVLCLGHVGLPNPLSQHLPPAHFLHSAYPCTFQTMGGKFIACLSGISAFVAIGLEHCITNMVRGRALVLAGGLCWLEEGG